MVNGNGDVMAIHLGFKRAAAIALASLALTSCAQLEIYSDAALTQRTGIPFYVAKPYLLVSRTGAKDKPVEVQVIYMPNLSQPYYARIAPGFGSSETSLAFANSVLTTVGQKSDTQLDELLTAYGGLQSALATADKTRRETDLLGDEAAPDYAAAAASLTEIANDIETVETAARQGGFLTTDERNLLTATVLILRNAAAKLTDPTTAESQLAITVASLENAAKALDEDIRAASAATAGPELIQRRNLTALRAQLGDVITTLKPAPQAPAAFTLYEIVISSAGTRLIEVAP